MEAVFDIFSYVFWVLVAITILVFVHELGHFLFAKLFGMRVDRFSIGFPPKIAGKQVGETEYVVGATPLGGYVKIAGMVDESMDTDSMSAPPRPWEFRAKPVWQRVIVITAGVIFNVIFAAFIYIGLKMAYGETYVPATNVEHIYVADSSLAHTMGLRTGDRIVTINGRVPERYSELLNPAEAALADSFVVAVEREGKPMRFRGPEDIMTQLGRSQGAFGILADPPIIGSVLESSAAYEAGLLPGDRIVAIDSLDIGYWEQMTSQIQASGGAPIRVRWTRSAETEAEADSSAAMLVARNGDEQVYEAVVAPRYDEEGERYLLGIGGPTFAQVAEAFGEERRDYGFGEAVVSGVRETWTSTAMIATSLRRVFFGPDSIMENIGGPIAIAKVTKEATDAGGARGFWRIVAFLSITLAIMNILPIPALDGGHLVFLIYEGITRREPSLRVRMVMQQVGMILLLVFMTFVIFNDILRL